MVPSAPTQCMGIAALSKNSSRPSKTRGCTAPVIRRSVRADAEAVRFERRVAGGIAAALDGGLDVARIGRLHEVIVEAGVGRLGAVFLLAVAGERDEEHMARVAAAAQLAR